MIHDQEEYEEPGIPKSNVVIEGMMGATIEARGGAHDGARAFLLIIERDPAIGNLGILFPSRDQVVYCINAMRRHLEVIEAPYDPSTEYNPIDLEPDE